MNRSLCHVNRRARDLTFSALMRYCGVTETVMRICCIVMHSARHLSIHVQSIYGAHGERMYLGSTSGVRVLCTTEDRSGIDHTYGRG